MIHRCRLVMFDMDGTFIDSKQFHTEVFFRFFNEYVMPVSLEETGAGMGNTVRDIFRSFHIPEDEFPVLFHRLDYFCRYRIGDLVKDVRVCEGMADVLGRLRMAGMKTAVVTNSMQCVAEEILKTHGLYRSFDYISGADIESMNKKSRCDRVRVMAGVEEKEVFYVGDSEGDLVLAGDMGYGSIFADTEISWCRDRKYVLEQLRPDGVVKDVRDLPDLLMKM